MDYKSIMEKINTRLSETGHSAAWLADKMECRLDHIEDWLSDEAQPNVDTVLRMLKIVGLKADITAA